MQTRSLTAIIITGLVAGSAPAADPERTGEQIYKQMCARCHGGSGQGSAKHFPHPLAGEKSIDQLAAYIAKAMPEDDPGTCTGEDAKKVAAYIHGAFYSKVAQARTAPPRVELSRLTVRQYRNSVSDLVGSFRPASKPDERHGLQAEYYKARRFRPADKMLDRLDPEVKFDFGTASPVADKIEAHEFSVRWQGSVVAPETGEYEFIVRTEHAARLWVNDQVKPLIDAWVKSGKDSEFRASIYLIAGRAYPLKMEFSKAKQGVDDSKKAKGPPPLVPASVALLWKPPGQAADVIPNRHLTPGRSSEAYVVAAPFPPDDRSLGWERGTAISKAWDQAATDAALDAAGYVAARADELAGIRSRERSGAPVSGNPSEINLDAKGESATAAERTKKLKEFSRQFVERAFRRPLTDELTKLYVDRQFEAGRDPEAAVKRVVLITLKSPRFLYREPSGTHDAYDVAARLSFGLWDSVPDKELLEAAAEGELATREQVAAQAERMLADPRARAKVHDFFLQWLKVDQHPDVAKDPGRFPGFDQSAVTDLRTSLDLLLEDVTWGESSDYRQLFLADTVYMNGRLAKLYGADLPADGPFQKVPRDPHKSAGVLSHPYLMASFAYTAASSPIHRGVFLARGVLGKVMRPPPEAFTPLPAELHPQLTTRERVALQTNPGACQSCHAVINPLGFTLEHFDAIGRYREQENGKPIDATGAYQTRTGELVKFAGVRDLATFLAGSDEAYAAFVEQLFHHLVKQPVRAYGMDRPEELRRSFVENRFSIRRLMVDIMTVAALPPNQQSR